MRRNCERNHGGNKKNNIKLLTIGTLPYLKLLDPVINHSPDDGILFIDPPINICHANFNHPLEKKVADAGLWKYLFISVINIHIF